MYQFFGLPIYIVAVYFQHCCHRSNFFFVSKQYNLLLARAVLPAAGKVKHVVESNAACRRVYDSVTCVSDCKEIGISSEPCIRPRV